MSKRNLEGKIHQLSTACKRADMTVDELLRRPLREIVVFTRRCGIRLEDVRDICQLLIQRLDDLDVECATFEHLTFVDPVLTSSGLTRVRASVN